MSKKATKYQRLRAALISRGTNPRRWARTHGLPVSSVYSAMRGDRAGIRATEIRNRIDQFLVEA